MKKLLITLTILLAGTLAWAGNPAAKVQTLVNEFRHNEGFDGITLGPLGLSLVKTLALSDSDMDAEDREVLKAFTHIRRLSILDFEDARPDVKERFVSRVKKILEGMELILEAKDDGSRLSIYGIDNGKEIKDCIRFDPSGTLICVRGSVTVEKLMAAVNND